MKHSLKITFALVLLFFVSQIIGLGILSQRFSFDVSEETGETVATPLEHPPGLETPDLDESQTLQVIIVFVTAILAATIIVLILAKMKAFGIWKVWFMIAVIVCLYGAIFTALTRIPLSIGVKTAIAVIPAIILGVLKIFKPNVAIHNITEVLIYGGLASIFVPIEGFTLSVAIIIIILIAIYDIIAVWHSKHMIKLAKFQTDAKMFAGLAIPYEHKEKKEKKIKQVNDAKKSKKTKSKDRVTYTTYTETKTAILGGGDIGFPLLFSGVVMKTHGLGITLIIPIVCAVALFLLLYYAKKDRFYPAMPFLGAGCLVGYGLVWILINLI